MVSHAPSREFESRRSRSIETVYSEGLSLRADLLGARFGWGYQSWVAILKLTKMHLVYDCLIEEAELKDRPTGRESWFSHRAEESLGSRLLGDLGLREPDVALRELALAASLATGVAHLHVTGAPLEIIGAWVGELTDNVEAAAQITTEAYDHFRSGSGVPGMVWWPSATYQSMLCWLASRDASVAATIRERPELWLVRGDLVESLLARAAAWCSLPEVSAVRRDEAFEDLLDHENTHGVMADLPALVVTSKPLLALVEDLTVAGFPSLSARVGTAKARYLTDDVAARLEGLTPLEEQLLGRKLRQDAARWADHRNAITHATLVRNNRGEGFATINGVCERVDGESLIPDWIEEAVFNGRYLAGVSPGGPTATTWLLVPDPLDLASANFEIDVLQGDEKDRPGPPDLAICWRDGNRESNDWSVVSLMLQDHPTSWGWLAVAAITRTVFVDLLEMTGDEILLRARVIVEIDDDSIERWLADMPTSPPTISEFANRLYDDHVLGGLQAAERSKSYDILELSSSESIDEDLADARMGVLRAEQRRADEIWGIRRPSDEVVDSRWTCYREARSRYVGGGGRGGRLAPNEWLDQMAAGITTEDRGLVHMMVEEGGVSLFWVSDAGRRREVVFPEFEIESVLEALRPWMEPSSLQPGGSGDPVSELIDACTPMADALASLGTDAGLSHLVLVPWRGLHSVPWAALSCSDGTPLRHHVRLSHAPAARLLSRHRGAERTDGKVLVVAAHGGTLPRADGEAEAVAAIHSADVLADGTSAEAIVAALSGSRIIHVAGHAAAGQHPLASAILVGHPPLPGNRIVSAARLHADADLAGCDLVFLNTCDSGRYVPPRRSLENHTGIDTAFLAAGATATISALWPVNDFIASVIGTVFHSHLIRGAPPHESLDAAVSVLRDGRGIDDVPEDVRPLLDTTIGPAWSERLATSASALQHPYWWGAWRISGADWLLEHHDRCETGVGGS